MFSPKHAPSAHVNDRHGMLLDPRSPSSTNTGASSPQDGITSTNTSYSGDNKYNNSDNASIDSEEDDDDNGTAILNYPPRFTLRVINPDNSDDDEEEVEETTQHHPTHYQQDYKPALVSSIKSATPEMQYRTIPASPNISNGNNENSEMVLAPPSSTPNSYNRNQENQLSPDQQQQLPLNETNNYSTYAQQQPLIRRESKVLVESPESVIKKSNNNAPASSHRINRINNIGMDNKKLLDLLPQIDQTPLLSENESHLLSPTLSLFSNDTSIFQSQFNSTPPELPQHRPDLNTSENKKVAPSLAQQSINAVGMSSIPESTQHHPTTLRSSRDLLNQQQHQRKPSYSPSNASTTNNNNVAPSRYSKASYSLTNHPDAIKLYRSMAVKTNDPNVQLTYAKYLLEVAALYDPKEKRQTFRPNLSLSLPTPKRPLLGSNGSRRGSFDSRTSIDTHMSLQTNMDELQGGGDEQQTNKKKKKMLEEEGVRWIKRLARQNVGEAAYLLALWYDRGMYSFRKSSSRAIKFYEVAATAKIPEAMYAVAQYHERERDYMTSFQLYEEAANLGLVEALYRIGLINLNGEFGSRRNVQTAIQLLIKASEKAITSCPEAPYTLGLLLINDYPTVNMPTELIQNFGGTFAAVAYFEHASEMGMSLAQYRLGDMYENGLYGTHVNMSKAYHYYELASNGSYPPAMLRLSRLCNHGIQMPPEQSEEMEILFEQDESDWIHKSIRNEDAAFRWCHLAADKHLSEAYYLLGWYYEMGIGVPRDYKQAITYYTKASKAGHNQAELRVNMLNAMTKQQKEDNKRATIHFQESKAKDSQCSIM